MRNKLRNLMTGRYGPDHLNIAMVITSFVINLLHLILRIASMLYMSWGFLVLSVFRMLSRNIERRRGENDTFIRYWWPVRTQIGRLLANVKHGKTHRFIKCNGCGNTLRVPKGSGKLQITCPKCGERFIKKT
ncbi:MAG: hypothetical protein FWG88_10080 [Oscillospiraceae bacterium]|nr:hypothetical protein [Oscillospiraceae bacterium]